MQIHYYWPTNPDTKSMFEAMWHDITNQTGGNITAVTIPVMFGRCVLKIISIPIYISLNCINFNIT